MGLFANFLKRGDLASGFSLTFFWICLSPITSIKLRFSTEVCKMELQRQAGVRVRRSAKGFRRPKSIKPTMKLKLKPVVWKMHFLLSVTLCKLLVEALFTNQCMVLEGMWRCQIQMKHLVCCFVDSETSNNDAQITVNFSRKQTAKICYKFLTHFAVCPHLKTTTPSTSTPPIQCRTLQSVIILCAKLLSRVFQHQLGEREISMNNSHE